MTQPLTILTPFNDVSELTDNFATRVDESQIMLPYGEPVEEGQWLNFVVQLADGSTALEGTGRSTGTHDNGEDYPPEYRYDVVLDTLSFAGMSEVMFERILQARASQMQGEPGTGEVDVNQLAALPDVEDGADVADVDDGAEVEDGAEEAALADEVSAPMDLPTEALPIEPSQPMQAAMPGDVGEDEVAAPDALGEDLAAPAEEAAGEDWAPAGDEFAEAIPTQAVHLDDLAATARRSTPPAAPIRSAPPPAPIRSAPPPAPAPSAPPAARPASPAPAQRPPSPQRAPGTLPALHTFEVGILTRPSAEPSWSPFPSPRPEAAQSSGLFDYTGGLPRPALPPRPELTDEQRVAAAPSPSAPWSRVAEADDLEAAPAS